MVGDVLDEQG
jgi:hypothetical protein